MRPHPILATILLSLLLATPSRAMHRQWWLEVPDPDRPDRIVGAEIHGPTTAAVPCAVAVLGHATLTTCEQYDYLAGSLAEAGWLVALPATEDGLPGDQAALAADMLLLARTLRDGSPLLPGDLPPARPGPFALLGHSLGGGAAVLAAAAAGTEVGALALLAPQDRSRPSMIAQAALVTAPVLIVSGELDCVTPPLEHHWPLFAALDAQPRALSSLEGGGHCAFAEAPEPCASAEAACPPLIDSATQQALTVALVQPWLAWRLHGSTAAGQAFLAAASASGVQTELVGIPTGAPSPSRLRLRALGPLVGAGTVRWALDLAAPVPVRAAIHDLRGRLVRRLDTGPAAPGRRELSWNGRDGAGRRAAAGVYLLRVEAGGRVLRSRTVRLD